MRICPTPVGKRRPLRSSSRAIDGKDAEDQRETGEYLVRVLDEDRLSDRKLFPLSSKARPGDGGRIPGCWTARSGDQSTAFAAKCRLCGMATISRHVRGSHHHSRNRRLRGSPRVTARQQDGRHRPFGRVDSGARISTHHHSSHAGSCCLLGNRSPARPADSGRQNHRWRHDLGRTSRHARCGRFRHRHYQRGSSLAVCDGQALAGHNFRRGILITSKAAAGRRSVIGYAWAPLRCPRFYVITELSCPLPDRSSVSWRQTRSGKSQSGSGGP